MAGGRAALTEPRPPEAVERLVAERSAARRGGDYATADRLRDEIRAFGWEVEDGAGGTRLRPVLPATGGAAAESRLEAAAEVDASIQVVVDDHPGDLDRFLRGLAAHVPTVSWELVVVANAPVADPGPLVESAAPEGSQLVAVPQRLGWADARNLGLRRSRGRATILFDTSLEPAGDFVTPLLDALASPGVGLAGGWGLVTDDGRQFHDAPPGEVHAIEAYAVAISRDALRAVGGFDPRFRFYRNADLDLSFAVRDAGWRAVATEPLPLVRHEHRGHASVSSEERDRLSRRNFYRFLDHWRERPDLWGADR